MLLIRNRFTALEFVGRVKQKYGENTLVTSKSTFAFDIECAIYVLIRFKSIIGLKIF